MGGISDAQFNRSTNISRSRANCAERLKTLTVTPSRRLTSRIEAHDDVWVYWGCNGRDDVSPVRDVSLGGVFIKTPKKIPETTSAEVYFLVEEGQIRADAVVRHTKPNRICSRRGAKPFSPAKPGIATSIAEQKSRTVRRHPANAHAVTKERGRK